MIDDETLGKLVSEYTMPRPEFDGKSYVTRRREWFDKPMEHIKPLLDVDHLRSLQTEEAEKIYNEMSVGGPKLYPKTFADNGLPKIRAALQYLLYGLDDIATRFHNFAGNPDSEYRLNGVGRAFASTALFLLDHNKYGIWNSAVDGGLKLLGLSPKKKPATKLGDHYVEIVGILKNLQTKCRFEDLSVVDEFVELIYHEKIGIGLFKRPTRQLDIAIQTEEPSTQPEVEQATHLRIQYLLVKVGQLRQYDVWVAFNDRNRTYSGEELSSICLGDLPVFAGPTTLRVARAIDVIWFKKRSAQPVCFFEIEHTTSMYSGLLRLNDVKTDYPIPRAFIVAPRERRSLFESQIQRPTFALSELSDVCQFMAYEEVERLMTSHEAIAAILP